LKEFLVCRSQEVAEKLDESVLDISKKIDDLIDMSSQLTIEKMTKIASAVG
jgi:hypothetical protein